MHRVGLVGAGTMGRTHARSYISIPGVELVGIYDVRFDAAETLAHDLGLPGSIARRSPEELLSDPDTSVISVCTPTPWHPEYVVASAEAGKHVFCEKPIAGSLAEGRRMVDACDRAGVRLMVGHVLRFFPEYQAARRSLEAGSIGRPGVVRTSRVSGFPRAWSDWYARRDWSGGVVLDMMIHDLDWLCWCLGRPVRVHAVGIGGQGLDHLDYALVTIRFESGAIAHAEGSWAHPGPFLTRLEVAGTEGLLEFQSPSAMPIRLETRGTSEVPSGGPVLESPLAEGPYLLEDKHFFECLSSGQPFLVSPEDAMLAAAVALAANESIVTGLPVEMEGWHNG